eukprot:Seg1225.8 transcript_id=Seg1225.8/GoldUCD/mRNA.D3Y31 product="hypothetical protein" protein_id=Seg1225.8/GoldUCD/D3Y31
MSTDSVADDCSTDGEEINQTRGAQITNRRTASGEMYANIAKAIVDQMSLTQDTMETMSKHGTRSHFWEDVGRTCREMGKKLNPKNLYSIWRQNRGNMQQIVSALLSRSPGSEKLRKATNLSKSDQKLSSVNKTTQETPSTRKKLELTFKRNRKSLTLPINQDRRENFEKFATKPIFVLQDGEEKNGDNETDKESVNKKDCQDDKRSDNHENVALDHAAFDTMSPEQRSSVNQSSHSATIDLMGTPWLDHVAVQHETFGKS